MDNTRNNHTDRPVGSNLGALTMLLKGGYDGLVFKKVSLPLISH
jgi:hypothetical protein